MIWWLGEDPCWPNFVGWCESLEVGGLDEEDKGSMFHYLFSHSLDALSAPRFMPLRCQCPLHKDPNAVRCCLACLCFLLKPHLPNPAPLGPSGQQPQGAAPSGLCECCWLCLELPLRGSCIIFSSSSFQPSIFHNQLTPQSPSANLQKWNS